MQSCPQLDTERIRPLVAFACGTSFSLFYRRSHMTAVKISVLAVAALGVCSIFGNPKIDSTTPNIDKAVHWLVSVQGRDGGWGQDGGAPYFVRAGERPA